MIPSQELVNKVGTDPYAKSINPGLLTASENAELNVWRTLVDANLPTSVSNGAPATPSGSSMVIPSSDSSNATFSALLDIVGPNLKTPTLPVSMLTQQQRDELKTIDTYLNGVVMETLATVGSGGNPLLTGTLVGEVVSAVAQGVDEIVEDSQNFAVNMAGTVVGAVDELGEDIQGFITTVQDRTLDTVDKGFSEIVGSIENLEDDITQTAEIGIGALAGVMIAGFIGLAFVFRDPSANVGLVQAAGGTVKDIVGTVGDVSKQVIKIADVGGDITDVAGLLAR